VKVASAPILYIADARSADVKAARQEIDSYGVYTWLGDQAFEPSLFVVFAAHLDGALGHAIPRSIVVSKLNVGTTILGNSDWFSNRRVASASPSHLPYTGSPSATAAGILLGEGLVFVLSSLIDRNKNPEYWSTNITVTVDGHSISIADRMMREKTDDPSKSLAQIIELSATKIANQYRLKSLSGK
jgi:hypothetical protein